MAITEAAQEEAVMVDLLERVRQSDMAMMPYGHTLGFKVEKLSPGEAVVVMTCEKRHHNVFDYTHGGAIFSLADTAIGLAHIATLREHQTATTVESKINFLRPALQGELRAHACTVKQGRTLSVIECDIFDEGNKLIARTSATMLVLEDERSDGRNRLHSPMTNAPLPHCPIPNS
jgi:acyl-CoA thioesterase